MAITTIKSTYSLDVDTVHQLEEMARRWRVSKSEALRRAIRAAARQPVGGHNDGLEALDELQAAVKLTAGEAKKWTKYVRAERRSSRRGQP
jgi:predicted transcriptional regulator